MGRKNRRLGNKELGPDVIKRILADNPTMHVTRTVSRQDGLRAEAVIIDDPVRPSEADRLYQIAVQACDRIIGELDEELRRK
jgi:hypothetical protein